MKFYFPISISPSTAVAKNKLWSKIFNLCL